MALLVLAAAGLLITGTVLAAVAPGVLGPGGAETLPFSLPVPPDGRPLYLWVMAGSGRPLAQGEVAVTYRNGYDLAVERVAGVIRIEQYSVRGKVEQLVLYTSPYRAVVFNRPALVRYRAAAGIPEATVPDQFFHHYDPELEGLKTDLRKSFLVDSYRLLLGRDPSEEEMLTGLHDLSRGVSLEEATRRLKQSRAAVTFAQDRAGAKPPWDLRQWWRRLHNVYEVLAGDQTPPAGG